ncbi:MAG: CotH kinase family protein, partial [Bacteroidetes bacterium]|nr:CotH kinase family protein [Bacteroidota bacterium]
MKILLTIIIAFLFVTSKGYSQTFTSSNLPIIILNTSGQAIPDDPRIIAQMGIIYKGAGQINLLTDPMNHYNGQISIETRGSSSQFFPKKSYSLETQNPDTTNNNVSLFGMPPENDWILYAPYSDKSLIRNILTYKLSNDMGRYASRTQLCEVVLNGSYQGVYVFMEKIKRDAGRVNIAMLTNIDTTGDQLTGGYIIKVDKYTGGGGGGWTSPHLPYNGAWQTLNYQFHYPKDDTIMPIQEYYIEKIITDWEDVMATSSYGDPVTGYSKYIDVGSFVDHLILNEIGRNVDGYRISSFLYKDRDSIDAKIHAGPVWDFNLAFGNADYYVGWLTNGWEVDFNKYFKSDGLQNPFWWQRLW